MLANLLAISPLLTQKELADMNYSTQTQAVLGFSSCFTINKYSMDINGDFYRKDLVIQTTGSCIVCHETTGTPVGVANEYQSFATILNEKYVVVPDSTATVFYVRETTW